MIIGLGKRYNEKCAINFGTHSGVFHCDEIIGIAILEIAYKNFDTYVVRTRDLDELRNVNIAVDVGGGEFDHHIKDFKKARQTGERYASAGLVWEKFASKAIMNVVDNEKVIVTEKQIIEIKEQIDREVIIPIDLEDNGLQVINHTFSFVTKFLPAWVEDTNYDESFIEVERISRTIFEKIIKNKIAQVISREYIQDKLSKNITRVLEIPSQSMPWLEEILEYNKSHNDFVKFVIFPYPSGGWAAQCVPPSPERKFEQLCPFPSKWAGQDERTLPEISGIKDAIFCHNGCFFARATSRDSIIAMCEIALTKK